jgi:hypothetical protein
MLFMPLAHAADWKRTILFCMIGAGLDGETQVGPAESSIDQSFSNILESLDLGAMGSFRAPGPGVAFQADVDQLIASYDIGHALNDRFELLAGARYNSIDLDLTLRGPEQLRERPRRQGLGRSVRGLQRHAAARREARARAARRRRWFRCRREARVAGRRAPDLEFRRDFFRHFGYRILDTDYEDGSGASYFKYDVTMSGPGAGMGWRFR